jgi:hypothetical protein
MTRRHYPSLLLLLLLVPNTCKKALLLLHYTLSPLSTFLWRRFIHSKLQDKVNSKALVNFSAAGDSNAI